jgi:hypothetical protein
MPESYAKCLNAEREKSAEFTGPDAADVLESIGKTGINMKHRQGGIVLQSPKHQLYHHGLAVVWWRYVGKNQHPAFGTFD